MALLAHGFALYHLVKQDRRIPVVTSLTDRVFNRPLALRCHRAGFLGSSGLSGS